MPIHSASDDTIAHLILMQVTDPWTTQELRDAIAELNRRIVEQRGQRVISVVIDGSETVGLPMDSDIMAVMADGFINFQGRFGIFVLRNAVGNAALEMLVRRMGKRGRNFAFATTRPAGYDKLRLFLERDTPDDIYF